MKQTITYTGDDLGGPYSYTEEREVPDTLLEKIKRLLNREAVYTHAPLLPSYPDLRKGQIVTIIDDSGKSCRAMVKNVVSQYTGDDYVLKEVTMDYFDKTHL